MSKETLPKERKTWPPPVLHCKKLMRMAWKDHTCIKIVQSHYLLLKVGKNSRRNKVWRTTSAKECTWIQENDALWVSCSLNRVKRYILATPQHVSATIISNFVLINCLQSWIKCPNKVLLLVCICILHQFAP